MIKIVRVEINDRQSVDWIEAVFYLNYPKHADMRSEKLVFKYSAGKINEKNLIDAAVFSLAPIAYWENMDIVLAESMSISSVTVKNLENLCDAWNKMFDFRRHIKVKGGSLRSASESSKLQDPDAAGMLFSGGVDSLATYANNKDKIEYLIFYNGTDIYNNDAKFDRINAFYKDFAKTESKKVINVFTNVAWISGVSWMKILHGCAYLGPLLVLNEYFDTVYISSTFSKELAYKAPWGSNPMTDVHVSNGDMKIIHYGTETNRFEKIRDLATSHKQLLKCLRVCTNNESGDFNCGGCEKCWRTMAALILLKADCMEMPFPEEKFNMNHIIDRLKKSHPIRLGAILYWFELLEAMETGVLDAGSQDGIQLKNFLLDGFSDFYIKYKNRHQDDEFVKVYSFATKLRGLERLVFLPPDALFFLRRLNRSFRNFVSALVRVTNFKL